MRISQKEKTTIVSAVHDKDPAAIIFLFGSRTRDELKGGDIDLLVVSENIDFSTKLEILVRIKALLGEQKIDLKILSSAKAAADPFTQSILPGAVRLND